MPLDISKLFKGGIEKPFFCQNIRGDIFFCDFYRIKDIGKNEECYIVDSYPLIKDRLSKSVKFEINSYYLDLYTKPVYVSNSIESNLALIGDNRGNIFITPKEELLTNYPVMYYAHSAESYYNVGDTDFGSSIIDNEDFHLMPQKFKMKIQF